MRKQTSWWPNIWNKFKKPWVLLAGFAVALAIFLTSLNSIAREVRDLPNEWGKTANQFLSWYYEYEKWPGHWTSSPEGWANSTQWNLSDEAFRLNLEVDGMGRIGGWVESKGI